MRRASLAAGKAIFLCWFLFAVGAIIGCRSSGGKRAEPKGENFSETRESLARQASQPTDSFVSFAASPKEVQLFWRGESGEILGSLGALKSFVEARGSRLRFAMNAGMYTEDQAPLGLFIAEGKTIRKLNRDTGHGNFYLKPNGVFFITHSGEAAVCRTQDFLAQKSVRWATQSGPMLLIGGHVHPAFKKGSPNLNVRNGVGILPDGDVLFAITNVPVSLYDFADYFKQKGCKNALYLDGFVSRIYLPEKGYTDVGGAFGVMIGVSQ